MAFNINEIKSQLQFGGARPSLFQVRILNPVTAEADLKVPFLTRAASIPGSSLSVIEVPYFGRKFKIAGTRTVDNWSVTIINDEDYRIRRALETWSNRINSYEGNLREFGSSAPSEYQSAAEVIHYGKDGSVLRTYRLNSIFPINISPMDLNWDSGDQIQEYQVEFAVTTFDVPGEPV